MSGNQTEMFYEEIEASHEEMMAAIDKLDVEDLSHSWPARLTEMYEVVDHHLDHINLEDHVKISAEIVLAIAKYFGGQNVYLPKGDDLKRAVRDAEIYKLFDGYNIKALAKKYRLTPQQIYSIIATQRKLRIRKIQPELF